MHEVLVNRVGGLSLSRKNVVRLTDRPDMTLDVYRGWPVGCSGFNCPLRQYFSLYRAVSQREGERGERIDERKNVETTPTNIFLTSFYSVLIEPCDFQNSGD